MQKFLSASEAAQRVGITRESLYKRPNWPAPDAMIGDRKGWLPETIDTWDKTIPPRGTWKRTPNTPTTKKENTND